MQMQFLQPAGHEVSSPCCRYARERLEEQPVKDESSEESVKQQRDELCRTIDELKFWLGERRELFLSVQQFIQLGLRSGRITEVRGGSGSRRQLSSRMISTVAMDTNHSYRCLLMLQCRLNKLQKELSELDEKIANAS
jgi:hypothetical protein